MKANGLIMLFDNRNRGEIGEKIRRENTKNWGLEDQEGKGQKF
jgi:hypothetical protein